MTCAAFWKRWVVAWTMGVVRGAFSAEGDPGGTATVARRRRSAGLMPALITKEKAPDRTIAIGGKKMKRSGSSRWRGGTNLAKPCASGGLSLQPICHLAPPTVSE